VAAHCLRLGIESAHELEGWWVDDGEVLRDDSYLGGPTWERVDADMCWGVDIYLEACRRLRAECGPMAEEFVERHFEELREIHPDCGGTGDYGVYEPFGLCAMADYKNGYGVVEHVDNYQLRTYLVGMMLLFPDAERYRAVVVQPNARHRDGPVRSVEYGREEVRAFADMLREELPKRELPGQPLVAGDWCKFCRAADDCEAARGRAFEEAGADFDDEPRALEPPPAEELDRLARARRWVPFLDGWCKAVEARVQELYDHGVKVPGSKLVQGDRGNRKWAVEDDAAMIAELQRVARASGVKGLKKADLLTDPKLKSPAQVEKISAPMKKALKATVDRETGESPLWTQAEGKLVVVDEEDPRPEATPSVMTDFDDDFLD
jgi:hypothetical protein